MRIMSKTRTGLSLLLITAFGHMACDSPSETKPPDHSCGGAAAYANAGPYAAGVTTLVIDGTKTEIWYPAMKADIEGRQADVYDLREWLVSDIVIDEKDAPIYVTNGYRDVSIATDALFPLILYSHGLGSYRSQSTFLMSHLASWGHVVAAPDHTERGIALLTTMGFPDFEKSVPTMRGVLDQLEREHADPSSRFYQRIDLKTIVASGHSAGASTAVEFAHDPRVSAYAPLSVDTSTALPEKPSLFMAGSFDEVILPNRTDGLAQGRAGDALNAYVLIFGAGHQVFTDICYIAEEHGGLLKLARKYEVPVPEFYDFLADDGCRPSDLKPKQAWPMIQHYVTALAKHAAGMDAQTAGFSTEAQNCFGNLIERYRQSP